MSAAACERLRDATGRRLDAESSRAESVAHCDRHVASLSAEERVAWALEHLPANPVLSSSFGAQSAVMLHLVTRQRPDIPVIVVDTGYLFPETYRFIDQLTGRLGLNLKVYRPGLSAAWQEARHGRRWEGGDAALDDYLAENKVEPMKRALRELDAGTWFAGLRRDQAESRERQPFVDWAGSRVKVHPILDWSDRDVWRYLKAHWLPYHPLWERGYVSIGDVHTTRSLHEVDDVGAMRFFGRRRECGLHDIDLSTV